MNASQKERERNFTFSESYLKLMRSLSMINRFAFLSEGLKALKPILRVDDHLVAVLLVLQSTF